MTNGLIIMLIDYHLHNHFSPDSKTNTKELLEVLQNKGIKNVCITNHGEWFDLHNEGKETFSYAEAKQRFLSIKKEINELKKDFPDMEIGFGIELQYRAKDLEETKKLVADPEMEFDLILGSIHFVCDTLIANTQYSGDLFEQNDEQILYTKYFKNVLEWVQIGIFDVMAHFDIIKKAGFKHYGAFKPEKYKPLIMEILYEMKKKGIGMELNTKCMYEHCNELFPHPDILKWCVDIGIENYTLGSDSHHVEDAGANLEEGLKIAKEVGITKFSTYKNRKASGGKI